LLSDIVAPILHMVQRIVVKFWITPPVPAALSLVPTTERKVTTNIEIDIEGPSVELLRALTLQPVHSLVLLQFERGWNSPDGNHDRRKTMTVRLIKK
jgi:hypothetical protein